MRILNINNFASIYPDAESISVSLEQLGHTVTRMPEHETTLAEAKAELANGYDLLLFEEGRLKGDYIPGRDDTPDYIGGRFAELMVGVPTVAWLTNIFFGIMRREVQLKTNPIFKADIVFSTDGGHDKEFKELGINHVCLRQGIFQDEAVIESGDFNTTAEVGFIGSLYAWMWPYRKELITFLQSTYGKQFGHFGHNSSIRHLELNKLVSRLKIVVGDSVYSPNYWSNRVYEIIGRGGFLIMPRIPGLEHEFIPYQHYIPYDWGDWAGLKKKIDYFLVHDSEREAIRKAGFEHCKANHTYKHRCEKMLEVLKERKLI